MGKRENTKIVMDGFNAEPPLSDDAILEKLYAGGVEFSELRTVFNEVIKDKGLRLSSKERKEKTDTLMQGTETIADAEAVLVWIAKLEKELKVASTKAMGSLRTWCKANNVVLPKVSTPSKPRKAGFGGHYEKILDFVTGERAAFKGEGVYSPTKPDVVAFCHKAGIPEAYATFAMNIVHYAQVWSGEVVVEATAEATDTTEAAE